VTDLLSPDEVEDRLRRTLVARTADVPPAEGDLDLERAPGAEVHLLPAGPPSPSRRGRVALAAAAAAVVAAVAAGALVAAGGEGATVVPAQQGGGTGPEGGTAPAPAPPTNGPEAIPDPPVTAPSDEAALLERETDLRDAGEAIDPSSPAGQSGGHLPTLVAGYRQTGVAPSQEVWLYLTWYPSPTMAREPISGYSREDVPEAETEAVLETAPDYPTRTVWMFYEDGVLGVHSGAITSEEVRAVAASVRRTPNTLEFASTPPAGWEPSGP
jgi:hypothetical protein